MPGDFPRKQVPTHPHMLARARELRQIQTEAEHTLWQELRNRKLHGLKFRRQRPETSYVMDFYCDAAKVVVELDGITHIGKESEDVLRDRTFGKNGYLVLRFENWQIWEEGRSVLERIAEICLGRVKVLGNEDRVRPAVPPSDSAADARSTPTPPHPRPLPMGEGGRGTPVMGGTARNGALSLLILALLAGLTSCAADPAASPLQIRSGDDTAIPIITAALPPAAASGLPAGSVDAAKASPILRLTRVDEVGRDGPAVFGSYLRTGSTLRFTPEFRLAAGGRYRATLSLPGQPPTSTEYRVPEAAAHEAARVERIYPSAAVLPANLLKFYVHFSRSMRQTDAIFDQLHILGENGEPVSDPWRRFPQWSDDGKRLTLWIHPGRVKRGVNLREEIGPVLVPGQRYRLVIDATLEDLTGQTLGQAFTKEFAAGPEDHSRISLQAWSLSPPRAGTREPLIVSFPRPLDAALLQRLLTVQDERGAACAGTISVGKDELFWTFQPQESWVSSRAYVLHADGLLEDLAGNTPVRVFDSEIGKDDAGTAVRDIPFRPR
jgi:very-short-patch-repair endonuclease